MEEPKVMTVRYRTRVKRNDNFAYEEYQLIPDSAFCCERMKGYLHDGAISFGPDPSPYKKPQSDSRDHCLHIFTAEQEIDCCEGLTFVDYPIYFCPGCGAEIKYVEAERVEMVRQVVTETKEVIIYVEKKNGSS